MIKKKKCVITGMGIVSCFGSNNQTYYESLLAGKSGVRVVDIADTGLDVNIGAMVQGFDPCDFLDKKQARRTDPVLAFSFGASALAIKDSGLDLHAIDKSRVGVIIGTGIGGMTGACKNFRTALDKNFSRVSPFFIPYLITNMGGALVSIEYGFTGPNYSISTACASANYSLLNAKRHIEYGECDIMISGGAEAPMNEAAFGGFSALHALSKDCKNPYAASKPFDKKRDGFVMGDGAGVFVLESEEHALKRGAKIYAELSGGAYNSDAHHMTNPKLDGSEVARCIHLALKDANITSDKVNYINAHATSTPIGDLCEMRAIKSVFGGNKVLPKINSTKSMIGHALGASGGLELAAILMAFKTNKLHPTINVTEKEEEIGDFDILDKGSAELVVDHAISNSFGFGGHNSVLVLSRHKCV